MKTTVLLLLLILIEACAFSSKVRLKNDEIDAIINRQLRFNGDSVLSPGSYLGQESAGFDFKDFEYDMKQGMISITGSTVWYKDIFHIKFTRLSGANICLAQVGSFDSSAQGYTFKVISRTSSDRTGWFDFTFKREKTKFCLLIALGSLG